MQETHLIAGSSSRRRLVDKRQMTVDDDGFYPSDGSARSTLMSSRILYFLALLGYYHGWT